MNKKLKSNLLEGIWKIERYGLYDTIGWTEDTSKDSRIYLILKNLVLMVMKNDTIAELIHLGPNVHMVLKGDSLGIAVKHDKNRMRKCRLKFASTHSYPNVLIARSCVNMLQRYVKVENLNPKPAFATSLSDTNDCNKITVSLAEHLSQLMEKTVTEFNAGEKIFSSMYPLENMIEICILDENFPSFVAEVHETLMKKLKKNIKEEKNVAQF